jgi:hypothetical protein
LGDAVFNVQGYEDGGVCGAISCAGTEGWDCGAEVSGAGAVVEVKKINWKKDRTLKREGAAPFLAVVL